MNIETILSEFKYYDVQYKKDAVDAAINNQQEITPYLIEILEDVYNETEKYLDISLNYFHQIYALVLLTHFEETSSHEIIVKILSMPNVDTAEIFGDFITESAKIALIDTCGNSTDKIIELSLNKSADDYSRTAAFNALSYAYMKGIISRDRLFDVFRNILTSEQNEVVCGLLAITLYYLQPDELMSEIKNAYKVGIISSQFINEKDFDEILKQPEESIILDLKARYEDGKIKDVHNSMSWWACFEKNIKKTNLEQTNKFDYQKMKSEVKKKLKKKSKNKQSKASRKANRK